MYPCQGSQRLGGHKDIHPGMLPCHYPPRQAYLLSSRIGGSQYIYVEDIYIKTAGGLIPARFTRRQSGQVLLYRPLKVPPKKNLLVIRASYVAFLLSL